MKILNRVNQLFWLSIFVIISIGCGKTKTTDIKSNPYAYKEYVNGFTANAIKRSEPIKILFNRPAVKEDQINNAVTNDIVSLSPKLNGEIKWQNEFTLLFIPDQKNIVSDQVYKVEVNLKKIFNEIPDSIKTLKFDVVFAPIEVNVNLGFLRYDPSQVDRMKLEGIINTTDPISEAELNTIFELKNEGNNKIQTSITSRPNVSNEYLISFTNIERSTASYPLEVHWYEKPEFKANKQQQLFTVPAKGSFTVTGVDDENNNGKMLQVYFSDPLNQNQDLNGLVLIKPDSAKFDVKRENDLLLINLSDSWLSSAGSLILDPKLSSDIGIPLGIQFEYQFNLNEEKPKVRFVSDGNILPYVDDVRYSFEAINLNKVDIEIFKIFSNNVLYNMHSDYQDDVYNMVKLGRIIHQQTLILDNEGQGSNKNNWKRYGLDLRKMIEPEPGAMYEIRIAFKPQYSNFACAKEKKELTMNSYDDFSGTEEFKSIWSPWGNYEYDRDPSEEYCYNNDDPCCPSYYCAQNFARRILLASNIAMIAKTSADGGQSFVMVNNILDGKPVSGSEVIFYDNQLQILGTSKTDGKGIVMPDMKQQARYVVAKSGKNFAYLKLNEGTSLSLSEFDVSGIKSKSGMKASIYTERGVWRPGDTIYLNCILAQKNKAIPETFPIQLKVKNPKGQVVYSEWMSNHLFGLYSFKIPTRYDAITGAYTATITVGLSVFEKRLNIETIKPNRFKVDWVLKDELNSESSNGGTLTASWLFGNPASKMKAKVDLTYSVVSPKFKTFTDYVFLDPEKSHVSGSATLFEGTLDANGQTTINYQNLDKQLLNGKVACTFTSRVFDPGGDMSTDYYVKEISPFSEYVGVKMPHSDYGNRLNLNEDQSVQFVALSSTGKPVANRTLTIDLYDVRWEWWYEVRNYSGQYSHNDFRKLIESKKVTTDQNGIATVVYNLKNYGRYFIKATNTQNDYSAGDYFYTGYPYDENDKSKEFISILNFTSDKPEYQVGEKAVISLPGASQGNYIISVIRENRILKHYQVGASKERTFFELDITKEMMPNVYLDVSFIQPASGLKNDLPLRMYGVISIKVEDKSLKLNPVISCSDLFRPEESFEVEVSEQSNRTMAYQLFIVDEGLLGLTRFTTPNPYSDLFQKEALTMMTWDNYDQIIGELGEGFSKMFSIGGDQAMSTENIAKLQRFKPVVLKTEPQVLKAGEKRKHKFTISNYVGSVRVMLISNNTEAYGSSEKTVPVKKELMTQLTFPRVVAINDVLQVPVTVFVSESNIKNVEVSLKTSGQIEIVGDRSRTISFNRPGDQTIYFNAKANSKIGASSVEAVVKSGSFQAQNKITFFVDNPNPITQEVKSYWLEPGATINEKIQPYGMEGTRKVKMSVSSLAGLKVSSYIDQLLQYPHGCVEQTTSAAFPQLYLNQFMELTLDQKKQAADHVQQAINKLQSFQLRDGGFSYWPGDNEAYDYASSYVGHFLIEAKNNAYQVPEDMLKSWYEYQSKSARSYSRDLYKNKSKYYDYNGYEFIHAYRLYTLALYGKPDWSAMNRLNALDGKSDMTTWCLAGAYALGDKKDIATKLIAGLKETIGVYRDDYISYGSNNRDEAIIALVLTGLDRRSDASKILSKIGKRITNRSYLSTQEMGMLLLAASKINSFNKASSEMKFSYEWNGDKKDINSKYSVYDVDFKSEESQVFHFTNNSSIAVSVDIIQSGKSVSVAETNISRVIKIQVSYVDKNGKPVDLDKLIAGADVEAQIRVSHDGSLGALHNLALTTVFPSGFEINNSRIGGLNSIHNKIAYQDFRDDRIMHYFNLNPGDVLNVSIPLTAVYAGTYLAPEMYCSAMYDPSAYARVRSGSVRISPSK